MAISRKAYSQYNPKICSKEMIPIYGKGNNIRDWLYVKDHIEALLTIAENGEIGIIIVLADRMKKQTYK